MRNSLREGFDFDARVCGIEFGESAVVIDLPHTYFVPIVCIGINHHDGKGMCVQDDEACVERIASSERAWKKMI